MNLAFEDLINDYDAGDEVVVCVRNTTKVIYAGAAKLGCDGKSIWVDKGERKFPLDSGKSDGVFRTGLRKKAMTMTFHDSEDYLDDDAKAFVEKLAEVKAERAAKAAGSGDDSKREEARARAEAARKARAAVVRGAKRTLADLAGAGEERRDGEDVDLDDEEETEDDVLAEEEERLLAEVEDMSEALEDAVNAAGRFVEKVISLGFSASDIKMILEAEHGHTGKLVDAVAEVAAAAR